MSREQAEAARGNKSASGIRDARGFCQRRSDIFLSEGGTHGEGHHGTEKESESGIQPWEEMRWEEIMPWRGGTTLTIHTCESDRNRGARTSPEVIKYILESVAHATSSVGHGSCKSQASTREQVGGITSWPATGDRYRGVAHRPPYEKSTIQLHRSARSTLRRDVDVNESWPSTVRWGERGVMPYNCLARPRRRMPWEEWKCRGSASKHAAAGRNFARDDVRENASRPPRRSASQDEAGTSQKREVNAGNLEVIINPGKR
ncbi:hypothetical protein FB451DRAFT_1358953 [Mycena latifolia]|nr:hypothetical protein FB451DRAFT_1358953 [Mycena latifolia]